jgi:hypothetical protein
MSPSTPPASEALGPLLAQTADRIAHVLNDLTRELDSRDGAWADARGEFVLTLASQTFVLSLTSDAYSKECSVRVQPQRKTPAETNGLAPPPSKNDAPTHMPRRASDADADAELVRDLVPRKRRADEHGETSNKRQRTADAVGQGMTPLISKDDLDDLKSTLREDVQEDTIECVNHVQRLLRRFRQEWHNKSQSDDKQRLISHSQGFRNSLPSGAVAGTSIPSPSVDRDDPNPSISIHDTVRQEAKLVSTQIKWVEECRRVAANLHNQREETWRTSSAGFHDRQRQDRENFQKRILHESSTQSQTLHQILNEVKATGLHTQNMKWETPNSHLTYLSPPAPTPPAFPTKPASTAPAPGEAGGRDVQR